MPGQDYPDIKATLQQKFAMASFLYDEITRTKSDRQAIQQLWADIQRMYDQMDIPEKKNFPFENAAHLMIPVMPSAVEQLLSKIMDTLYTPEDPMTPRTKNGQVVKYATALRNFATYAIDNELNLEDIDTSLFLQMLKLGPTVAKIGYNRQTRTIYTYNEATEDYDETVEIIKDSPEVLYVDINDFLFPTYARSLQDAEWKAHHVKITWNEVKRRIKQGLYNKEAVEKINYWYQSNRDAYESQIDKNTMAEPSNLYEFDFYEVWFEYALDYDDGKAGPEPTDDGSMISQINNFAPPVQLVGVLHLDSKTWLRLQYNWYPLGMDPFELCNFSPRENRILGMGAGQMAMPFQAEVSAMHNQRLDNATVANSAGFVYRADSTVPSNLPLTPGRGIPADDPKEDIVPLQIGTKYDSTINEESLSLELLKERLGIKEVDMDTANMSRAPATSTLAMMENRGRRLDNTIRNIRRFKKRIFGKVMLMYKRYYPLEQLLDILGQEDGMLVIEYIKSTPDKVLYNNAIIEVTATTSATSRELDRQSKLALFNLLVQYYGQVIQYTSQAFNPQVPPQLREGLARIAEGLTEFVGEILEDFNVKNKTEFLVSLQQAIAPIQQASSTSIGGGLAGTAQLGSQPPLGLNAGPTGTAGSPVANGNTQSQNA